jgi:hypothetical protein
VTSPDQSEPTQALSACTVSLRWDRNGIVVPSSHQSPLVGERDEVALHLADSGFPVVPCHYPLQTGIDPICSCSLLPLRYQIDHTKSPTHVGKHPVGRLVPNGVYDATMDRNKIKGWLKDVPDLNFGIATGRRHLAGGDMFYLVVIDPDSAEAEQQLRLSIVMPKTFQVITGNGKHLYFSAGEAMSNETNLLTAAGISGVDVRGLGGYVMAPGSLHYSGAIYTACGSISDIVPCSTGLREHLVPASQAERNKKQSNRKPPRQRITTTRTDKVVPITDNLPRLDEDGLSDQLLQLLHLDPAVGDRSEPGFHAFLALLDVTDDDDTIVGTITHYPIGKRLHEHPLSFSYQELERARNWKAVSPEERKAKRLQNQQHLVEKHWLMAGEHLSTGTLKVLWGFGQMSIKRGGGTFAASLDEVAIEAGVERSTVIRHRKKLVGLGWLSYGHRPTPGNSHATTYRLSYPDNTQPPDKPPGTSPTSPIGRPNRTSPYVIPQGVGWGMKMSEYLSAAFPERRILRRFADRCQRPGIRPKENRP